MKQRIIGFLLIFNLLIPPFGILIVSKLKLTPSIVAVPMLFLPVLAGLFLLFSKNIGEPGGAVAFYSKLKLRHLIGIILIGISIWCYSLFNTKGISFFVWIFCCFISGMILILLKNRTLGFTSSKIDVNEKDQ